MMSFRRRSQEDDKEEDFVNKAPSVFSLKRKYNLSRSLSLFSLLDARSIERLSGGVKQYYSRLRVVVVVVVVVALKSETRAFQRCFVVTSSERYVVNLSLQERYTKLLFFFFFFWLNVRFRSKFLGQLSLHKSLSLSQSLFLVSQKNILAPI
jgi:hypothetical protein